MPTTTFTVDDLARVSSAIADLISGIDAEQWDISTPCSQWNVRDVVGHLVGGDQMFAALLNGEPMPTGGGDPLGSDPAGAYRASAAALQEVAGSPGVAERACAGPLGDSPTGADLIQLRLADLLVHGWDIGQAIGAWTPHPDSDELIERSLAFMRGYLTDEMRGAAFDAAQPVGEAATALERLVAFCGRPVG